MLVAPVINQNKNRPLFSLNSILTWLFWGDFVCFLDHNGWKQWKTWPKFWPAAHLGLFTRYSEVSWIGYRHLRLADFPLLSCNFIFSRYEIKWRRWMKYVAEMREYHLPYCKDIITISTCSFFILWGLANQNLIFDEEIEYQHLCLTLFFS